MKRFRSRYDLTIINILLAINSRPDKPAEIECPEDLRIAMRFEQGPDILQRIRLHAA